MLEANDSVSAAETLRQAPALITFILAGLGAATISAPILRRIEKRFPGVGECERRIRILQNKKTLAQFEPEELAWLMSRRAYLKAKARFGRTAVGHLGYLPTVEDYASSRGAELVARAKLESERNEHKQMLNQLRNLDLP